MERKFIPLVLMLMGGGITCIFTMVHNYSLVDRMIALLVVLLVFFVLGSLLTYCLDYFDKVNGEKEEAKRREEEEAKRLQETEEAAAVALKGNE